jgi:hypothetical protein
LAGGPIEGAISIHDISAFALQPLAAQSLQQFRLVLLIPAGDQDQPLPGNLLFT